MTVGSVSFVACGDGNSDDGMGGSGGTSTGSGGSGASTGGGGNSTGGGGGSGPTSACDPGNRGTNVAAGTCNTINDFAGADEFSASFDLASDERTGAGIDIDATTSLPRLSGGKDASGTGTLEVVDDGRPGGDGKSVEFKFSGAKMWGGAFTHLVTNDACYDASKYTGITFWAKASSEAKSIFVAAATAAVNPLYDCASATPDADCYNSARKVVEVTDAWAQYSIEWDEFARPTWGANWGTNPDPKQLIGIIFADNGQDADDNTIDLFVDDLSFTGGDASACGEIGAGGAGN